MQIVHVKRTITVAEYLVCKVLCLIQPPLHVHFSMSFFWEKNDAQSAGFEPARAEPNGFLVHRLNHSATTAMKKYRFNVKVKIDK